MLFLLILPAVRAAVADVIQLRNGNSLEGIVEILADGSYSICSEDGSRVVLSREEIADHVVKESPQRLFERRFAEVDRGDRSSLLSFADWVEEQGWKRSALLVYREVLRIDPNHHRARDRLGFILADNRWVSRRRLEREGWTEVDGAWLPPALAAEARDGERLRRFERLLQDARHGNPYLRQLALQELFACEDPALIPTLRSGLTSSDPLQRLLMARVLANHPFEVGAEDIYQAFLREVRDDVAQGQAALLRGFADERLAEWIARDIRQLVVSLPAPDAADPVAVHSKPDEALVVLRAGNLRRLGRVCPHEACAAAWVELIDHPRWGSDARAALEGLLQVMTDPSVDWREYWAERTPAERLELSREWLKPRVGATDSERARRGGGGPDR